MKKVLAISILAAMLLTIGAVAMADTTNWYFKINATDTSNLSPAGDVSAGWMKNYTDGVNTGEGGTIPAPGPGGKLATIVAIIPGTTTPSMRDFHTPYSIDPTLPKTWTFQIYAQGTGFSANDAFNIHIKPQTGQVFPAASLPVGTTVEFAGAFSKVYTAAEFGALAAGSDIIFPVAGAGGATAAAPMVLTMTIKGADVITPEPSSMVALASGLFGLVGFGIRRRK